MVEVRNVELGAGMPKVAVPVMGSTTPECAQAAATAREAGADVVEWRADFLEDLGAEHVRTCAEAIRAAIGDTPLLFTLRSTAQGGESRLTHDDAAALIREMATAGIADIYDVEMENPHAKVLVNAIREAQAASVVSDHNFEGTPAHEELYNTFQREIKLGADIAKVAVMATTEGDELRLMAATNQFAEDNPGSVLVGISMGELGAITRVAGEFFGSALTFCSAGKASAPGQLDVATARAVMQQLHEQSVSGATGTFAVPN